MTFAIIGSGNIGRALAHQFARKNIEVRVANSRGPDAVGPLQEEHGGSIVPSSIDEALSAEIVIMAVPNPAVLEIAHRVGDWQGRILVDATNAIDYKDFTPKDLGGRLSSDIVAEAVPTARVVKAFNTLPAAILDADPAEPGGHRIIFLSGSDTAAKADVAKLAERLGYAPLDLGRIDEGGRLAQFGGPLMVHSLIKQS